MFIFGFFSAEVQSETLNEKRLRLARERETMGRDLVTSAANGDVQNCRIILEREKLIHANQINEDSSDKAIPPNYVLTPRLAALGWNYTHTPSAEELILTNFVSSGHTPLQAAAQNGHVDVCRLLIGEYNANVEFQVILISYVKYSLKI